MNNIVTIYLIKRYIYFFITILISLGLFFLGIDLLQNYKYLPSSANLRLLYVFYNSFFIFTLILPLSLCFAFILTLVSMIRTNEFVALLSLGLTPKKIYSPIIMLSSIILLLLIVSQVTPLAYSYDNKSNILNNRYLSNSKTDLFLKYDEYFIYIKKLYPLEKRASGIEIFHIKGDHIINSISSSNAYFKDNRWYVMDSRSVYNDEVITWDKSKITIKNKRILDILDGFNPQILNNVYDSKSNYSIQDALYTLFLFNDQNISTHKIRSIIYYKLFSSFFILPLMIFIYSVITMNNRFFNIGIFLLSTIFLTLLIWGILFMFYKFSLSSIISPELGVLLPLIIVSISFLMFTKIINRKI